MTKGFFDRFPSSVGKSLHEQGAVGGYSAVSAFPIVVPVGPEANPLSGKTNFVSSNVDSGSPIVEPVGSDSNPLSGKMSHVDSNVDSGSPIVVPVGPDANLLSGITNFVSSNMDSGSSVVVPVGSEANPLLGKRSRVDATVDSGSPIVSDAKPLSDNGNDVESDDERDPELVAAALATLRKKWSGTTNCNLPRYFFPPGTTDRTHFRPVQLNPADLIPSSEGLFRFVFPESFGTLVSQDPSEMVVTRGSVEASPCLVFPEGGTVKVNPGGYLWIRDLLYPGYCLPVGSSGCTVVVPVGGKVLFCENLAAFHSANDIVDDDVEIYANFKPGDSTGGRFLWRY